MNVERVSSGELARESEFASSSPFQLYPALRLAHVREKLCGVPHGRDRRGTSETVAESCRLDRTEKISAKVNEAPGWLMGIIIDVHESDNIEIEDYLCWLLFAFS